MKQTLLQTFKSWLPVLSLCMAAFIFVTTEFMPIGLLPEIAADFGKTEAFTGLIMTIYAWIVATLSLPLTVFTAKFDRKKLMMGLLLIFIVAHVGSSLATSFELLLLARILVAVAHSIFWSISIPLAARLAPQGKRSQALAMISTSTALANVLGIPFGTLLGHAFGWRAAFIAVMIFAFLVLVVIFKLLESLPSTNAGSFKSLPSLFKRPALVFAYIMTVLVVTGHFTAMTYITPLLQKVGGQNSDTVVALLLVIGFSGIIGSIISGKYLDHYPKTCLLGAMIAMAVCLFALTHAVTSLPLVIMVFVVWGACLTLISLFFQTTVLNIAHDAADVAASMYSGIFNIGIGGGALLGSIITTTQGLGSLGYAASAFIVVSLMITMLTMKFFVKPSSI